MLLFSSFKFVSFQQFSVLTLLFFHIELVHSVFIFVSPFGLFDVFLDVIEIGCASYYCFFELVMQRNVQHFSFKAY